MIACLATAIPQSRSVVILLCLWEGCAFVLSRKFGGGLITPAVNRWASVVVSAALASGCLAAIAPAVASAEAPSAATLGPAQAQDEASALLMARLQDRQIEVLGDRTDASQTFANPDGALTYDTSADPRWVQQGGVWKDLDPTLVATPSGGYAPVLSESPLTLSGGGTSPLATMTVSGKQFSLSWPDPLPVPTVSGATATYANVLPSGVDLQVTATVAGGVEESLIVENAAAAADPALASLVLAARGSAGTTVSADAGGNLTVKDSAGNVLVTSPAPVMWDSSTSTTPASAAPSASASPSPSANVAGGANAAGLEKVKVASLNETPSTRSSVRGPGSRAHQGRVKVSFSKHKLTLVPDHSLLTAKSTVFPVIIDPAYVPHSATGSTLDWDAVQQGYPTTSEYNAAPGSGLGVGYQGFSSPTGIERTYYELSIPTSVYKSTILSATMNTTVTYAAASGSNSDTIDAFSTCAISSATTWNNQPCKSGSTNPNYPSPNATATFTTTSTSPNKAVSFNVTAGLQLVANESVNNWTMGLYNSTETNDVDLVRFADNPTFSITYDTPPTTPTALSASPTATAGYAASGTPKLSSSSTDANGDTVQLDYEILSGSTVKASGSTSFVNSGTAATWAPTTALADGSYTWQVRAYDGDQYSAWTAAQPLVIDTVAPANSMVSSTDFPSQTWSGTPDANGNYSGSFTFTPPTTDVANVAWQLDGGAWNQIATTGSPVSQTITFPVGPHTLVAKTVDAAGNWAGGTTYSFYAGSGAALTLPSAGERPARRVALMALGLTSYTGASYQYRYGETDSWHTVPVGDVTVTSSGAALAAWPVALTNGAPESLTWNITNSLAQDGPVDVRALFTDGTNTVGSPANTITVDRNAGTAPTVQAGPASVNTLTGDAELSATDASAFGMTVTRTSSSRRPTNGASQTGQAAIFGPQWTAGTTAELTGSDWSYIQETSPTSVGLVDVDGDQTGFTAVTGGGWKPEPGAEDLTLTGSLTGSFTLKESEDGTVTTFTKPSGLTTWQVSTTYLPTSNSTTTVVPQTVTVGSATLARPQYVIAPTSAVAASTCQTTPSTEGCRMLEYDYATTTTATSTTFGDYAGQVQQIRLWATTPGATTSTATVIAQYSYDNLGDLRQEWDPRISPSLITSYTYTSTGQVATETDPGQLPWTFTYGDIGSSSVAGSGMLLSASRPTLQEGSNTVTDGGTAATTLVYGVPLTGSSAPHAMGPTDVAAWGQTDVPTDATAVFPADQVPASSDGTTLGAGDYADATITYTDASGREVNSADPDGHTTTTEYDQYGNTVVQLTAANRELALGTASWQAAEQQSLGILGDTTAQRAEELSTTSTYNVSSVAADAGTDKNTDPANIGQRELEELGPIHLVTLTSALDSTNGGTNLAAGTVQAARQDTVNTYDQGRPTDGTATVSNEITTSTVGAFVAGYTTDGDVRTSTTAYDWVKGLPTVKVTDPSGLKLTTTTAYDSQGRVISTSLPKSDGSDAGTTVTAYWSATGTGACNGHPEWADMVCSTGPAAAVTGGGSNPSQMPTTTTTYDRWGNPATVAVTANGVTRTTTSTYDTAGRISTVAITGGLGTSVATTTTAYDPATGNKASVTANGQTITYTYDALGRQTQYTDGDGNGANTSYNDMDQPVTVTDSAPSTTTYAYDAEGQVTTQTDSVAGTITASYDPDGNLYAEDLPGGIDLSVTRDQTDEVTGRDYTLASSGAEITGDYSDYSIQGDEVAHSSDAGVSAYQAYTYDADGRLTNVDDTEAGVTTQRSYSFDGDSNRTGLTSTVYNPDGSTASTTSTAYTYDSGDRLQTVNGTGVTYDALGRTTNQADGTRLAYYTNDLAQQETNGNNSQTWNLDAAQRIGNTQTVNYISGVWTLTDTTTNHSDSDTDSPDWIADSATGTITRNVQGIDGNLAATTNATGDTVLQLTNIHGDVTVQYTVATQAMTAQAYDEYGNPINGTAATTYGWLGAKQRVSDTPSGLVLMGARLYNPATGRFLSLDPVPGGSANAYDYADQQPLTNYDLDGHMVCCYNGGGYGNGTHDYRYYSYHPRYYSTPARPRFYGGRGGRFRTLTEYNERRAGSESWFLRNHDVRACTTWGSGGAVAGAKGGLWGLALGFLGGCGAAVWSNHWH